MYENGSLNIKNARHNPIKTLKIVSLVEQRYSDAPQKGTVFIISLPIKKAVLLLKGILEKSKEISEHVGFLVRFLGLIVSLNISKGKN